MAEKKRGKTPGSPPGGNDPGHLGVDDRGNVTWEWKNDEELLSDDTLGQAERLQALADPNLQIVDDDDPRTLRSNPKGLKQGYNPYDSGALGKRNWKKKKDLRELSEWVKLRKKVEGKTGAE